MFVQLKEIDEELSKFKKMDSTFHFFFNSKPRAPISNLNESHVEQEDTRASSISTQLHSRPTWTRRARLEFSSCSTQLEQNARYKQDLSAVEENNGLSAKHQQFSQDGVDVSIGLARAGHQSRQQQ